MSTRARIVAVCGASQATDGDREAASSVGRMLAERGYVVVCGGGQGVAAAVADAVRESGGTCIGLLPGDDPESAVADVTVPVATGIGHLRNALIVRSCDAMIAIGGGYGTLSEIAFGLVLGRPVVTLQSWTVCPPGDGAPDARVHRASTPAEAIDWLVHML